MSPPVPRNTRLEPRSGAASALVALLAAALILLPAFFVATIDWSGAMRPLGDPDTVIGPIFAGGSVEQSFRAERMALTGLQIAASGQRAPAGLAIRLLRAGEDRPIREVSVQVAASEAPRPLRVTFAALPLEWGEALRVQVAVLEGKAFFGGDSLGPDWGETTVNGEAQPESLDLAIGPRGSGKVLVAWLHSARGE